MPWVYGDEGIALVKKYFTLRTQLIPYLYTYTWRAHRDSVPILRPLYFESPELEEAYRHSREYFFGREMLIAPVVDPSGNQSIYLPPGQWMDFFTGKRYSGGASFTLHYDVSETPVFVREGSIIPEQPPGDYSDAKPLDTVILNVYGGGEGHFDLYEDDGISLAYDKGQSSVTSLTHSTDAQGVQHLLIGPAQGSFKGQVAARTFELHIHTLGKPGSISLNGKDAGPISWDSVQATATVTLPRHSIRDRIEVTWR